MRGFLESFLSRLRERSGRRPARPAVRPALSLERLEDRRLLSATTASGLSSLLNPANTTSTTLSGSATPGTSGAAASAAASTTSAVTITQVTGSALDAADWQAEAVYRMVFASYLANLAAPVVAASPGATSPQTTAAPTPSASSGNSSTPANVLSQGPIAPQTTTAPSNAGAAAAPTPAASSQNGSASAAASTAATSDAVNWQADVVYRVAFSEDQSVLVRVRVGVGQEGQDSSADGGGAALGADSNAAAGGASDANADSAGGTTDPDTQGENSVLIVEISVAADPAQTASSSDASTASAMTQVAALRLTIAPPGPDPSDTWSVGLTTAAPTGDGSGAGDAAQATGLSLGFLLLVSPVAASSGAPAAPDSGPSLTGLTVSPLAASPGPVTAPAATAAAQPDGQAATISPSVGLEPTAIADMVLAEWSGPGSRAEFAGAVVEATPCLTAVAAGRTVETPAPTAEQWAAFSVAMKEALVAGAPTDAGFPGWTAAPHSWDAGAATGAAAGHAADTERFEASPAAPFAVLGGVFLPAFGLGRSDTAAAGSNADAVSPVGMRIAEAVRDSTESLTGLVRGLYRALLGRAPQNGEETGWVGALLAGQTEEQFLEAFLSTAEFGQRAVALGGMGTPDEQYVRGLFSALLRRSAATEEVSAWLASLPDLGRDGVVACLVRSNEFRALQIQSFYVEFYGQEADPSDAAAWAASPLHLLAIRDALATRPDLFGPESAADATAVST